MRQKKNLKLSQSSHAEQLLSSQQVWNVNTHGNETEWDPFCSWCLRGKLGGFNRWTSFLWEALRKMDRIYRQSDMKTHFTPVTGYFKLNVMAKRQMCRQAAKMLQPCLWSQGSHSAPKHSLHYRKHTMLTYPEGIKSRTKNVYIVNGFIVSSFCVTLKKAVSIYISFK